MNQYQELAERLLGRQSSTTSPASRRGDLSRLRDFLRTSAGREAARAAVERVITTSKTMGQLKMPVHQEVVSSLLASMQNGVDNVGSMHEVSDSDSQEVPRTSWPGDEKVSQLPLEY